MAIQPIDIWQEAFQAKDATACDAAVKTMVQKFGTKIGSSKEAPDSDKGLIYNLAQAMSKLVTDKVVDKADQIAAVFAALKGYEDAGGTNFQQFKLAADLKALKSSSSEQYDTIKSIAAPTATGADEFSKVAEGMVKSDFFTNLKLANFNQDAGNTAGTACVADDPVATCKSLNSLIKGFNTLRTDFSVAADITVATDKAGKIISDQLNKIVAKNPFENADKDITDLYSKAADMLGVNAADVKTAVKAGQFAAGDYNGKSVETALTTEIGKTEFLKSFVGHVDKSKDVTFITNNDNFKKFVKDQTSCGEDACAKAIAQVFHDLAQLPDCDKQATADAAKCATSIVSGMTLEGLISADKVLYDNGIHSEHSYDIGDIA